MSWLNAQVYVDLTCYMLIDIEHVTFWDTNTSQGSVAKLQATNRVPRPVDRGTATRYGG